MVESSQSDQSVDLTFAERIELMRLVAELRQTYPIGIVGLIETRNLLARLFPDYAQVKDSDLDKLLDGYAEDLATQESIPPVGPIQDDPDRL